MQITKSFTFEAAHRLPHVPPEHKCHRLHGHSFRVTVELRGEVGEAGWVRDFADITSAWRPLHDQLDHHYLNEVDGLENPTSEHVAAWVYVRLMPQLPELWSVTVAETCTSSATYAPRK